MMEFIVKLFGASWRSTILGWVGIATALAIFIGAGGKFLTFMFDDKPETVPSWEEVSIAWVALVGGIRGLVSRDNKASTEAVKAAGTEVK